MGSLTRNLFAATLFSLAPLHVSLLAQTAPEKLAEVSASKILMGTIIDMIVVHPQVQPARNACYHAFREIERIEKLLSSHQPESEIARINQHAGHEPVKVSYETYAILARAIAYSKEFGGAFDVTIGPLVDLWGFNGEKEVTIPEPNRLAALLPLVGYENLALHEKDTTVALLRPGMRIDLGGIAKGYAIDRAAMTLEQHGVDRFLINAGGDIYASGLKAGDRKWRVGVRHPRRPDTLLATCELSDFAVATSGDYERFAEINGRRYHHILNPQTGYPADLCQSVTVFAPTAEEADVWATYLFVIGFDNYRKKYAGSSMPTLFVDRQGSVHCSRSLRGNTSLKLMN